VDGLRESSLALVGKTALLRAASDDRPALTLAWSADWLKAPDQSFRQAQAEAKLVLSVPVAGATAHLNLGHERSRAPDVGTTTWAAAMEWDGMSSLPVLAPMVEVFGNDREAPWWNTGLRFTAIADRLFLDLSYGRQFASGTPSLLTAGFKLAF
jgi:hypothetical protein